MVTRRQEIACIGQQIDKEQFVSKLDDCLLTDDEMAAWEVGLLTLENSFLA